jgi:hypothetical protein
MTKKMPRGAIPVPRNELAASEPYRYAGSTEIFVPSGEFPTPNHELASALPYKASGATPESFITWPIGTDRGWHDKGSNSIWAEEAFAKACSEPTVLISANLVLSTSKQCGLSNFAAFMQTEGFHMNDKAYLDGPFNSVSWTNVAVLNGAIANAGPVKIGIASASLTASNQSQITAEKSGWAIYNLPKAQPGNYCASLCGYGSLRALVDLFEQYGVKVNMTPGMPTGLCYAMFALGSIGIIDLQSLMNITGEAWVRNPTTVVKHLSG